MESREKDIKNISTQLLAGMLANPHIYPAIADEEGKGRQEQILISNAIMMAESLIEKIEQVQVNRK